LTDDLARVVDGVGGGGLERKKAAVPTMAATAFASLESRVPVLPVPPLAAASPSFFRPPIGHSLAALRTRQDVIRQNKPTFQAFRKCHHAHPICFRHLTVARGKIKFGSQAGNTHMT
jgi:hypothetical protein